MEISKFTIGIIFIFLPGIVALLISERLTNHSERKPYELVVYALTIGCAAHLIYGVLQPLANVVLLLVRLSVQLEKDRWLDLMLTTDVKQVAIQGQVVAFTAIIGVFLGFLVARAANNSWIHRLARYLKVSNKFADIDVWTYLMNSGNIEWILLRDHANNLAYQGYVMAFSSEEDPREILLGDVTVFTNDSSQKLYDVKSTYLSFAKENVAIELL
jgi:hypothetical protein